MMRTKRKYQKGLNKNDPFDQLIIELAEKGVLDVCAVEIRQEPSAPETHTYPKKTGLNSLKKTILLNR